MYLGSCKLVTRKTILLVISYYDVTTIVRAEMGSLKIL